jgi:hypothetical protein
VETPLEARAARLPAARFEAIDHAGKRRQGDIQAVQQATQRDVEIPQTPTKSGTVDPAHSLSIIYYYIKNSRKIREKDR